MHTTWGSIRRTTCVAGLCLALGLQGCISPTQYARSGTDEAEFKADKDDCAQWEPFVQGVIIGAGFGAMSGAAVSANGATDRNAAIVALVIGVLYGVATGAIFAQKDVKDYDRCMMAKGYHPI